MVDYNHSSSVMLWYSVGGLALHSNKSCSFPSMDQQFLGPKSSAKSFHHKQNEGGKKPAGHQHLISPQEVSGTSTWHYGATPSAGLTVLLQEHICYLLHLSKAMVLLSSSHSAWDGTETTKRILYSRSTAKTVSEVGASCPRSRSKHKVGVSCYSDMLSPNQINGGKPNYTRMEKPHFHLSLK